MKKVSRQLQNRENVPSIHLQNIKVPAIILSQHFGDVLMVNFISGKTLQDLNIQNEKMKSYQPLACQYFVLKMLSTFFSSAAYIQVHLRLGFIMEANNMNPDQTAPLGAV